MNTLNLTWDQLNEVKSPAATIGAADALVELIESTVAEGGRVTFAAIDGTITDVLNNARDLERWKQQNATWLGDDDDEFEELEPGLPLDDDEFEEVVKKVRDSDAEENSEQD